jgi:hopanoid biosynthesis associated RND transporter like protein HpnN
VTPSPIVRLVKLSILRPWRLIALVLIACAAMMHYLMGHLTMTTDTDELLSHKLPWRVRQAAFNAAFSRDQADIVVVIDALTPELGDAATTRLAADLRAQPRWFRSVAQPDSGAFWTHERLLFASTEELKTALAQLIKAQPFLGSMASDPSLRGLADTLSLILKGVDNGEASLQDLRTPIQTLARALHGAPYDEPSYFSWRTLISGHEADQRELRHTLLIDPILDFTQLQPGKGPVDAIRSASRRLELDTGHGVRIRLTGPVPLADQEFATLAQRAGLIAALAGAAIILMLWSAVRSSWLIGSILLTTLVGLLAATTLGILLFHRLNLISVAFIPLFVGMGMDLGIQFSVRYRSERAPGRDVSAALLATARGLGKSLTLAATAIAVGFLAFAPTAYYGVSQLGTIAGLGLFVALALNLTLSPALIRLTAPRGAPARPRPWRVRLEEQLLGHRSLVLGAFGCAALLSAAVLPRVRFDFNPIHLRSARVESVATLIDLMHDPDRSPNTLEAISPDLRRADRLAASFRLDPTVYSARTLSSFIPTAQPEKLARIADAANLMDLTLNPLNVAAPPSDQQVIGSLTRAATKLRQASTQDPSLGTDVLQLAGEFDALARGAATERTRTERLLLAGFVADLEYIRDLLRPKAISIDTLPPEIVRQWQSSDGRSRVSVVPKGDSNDDAVLRRFVASGLAIAPDATGPAVYFLRYGQAVVNAFIEAGVLSFVAICGLLLLALRRIREVAITMAPILLTGLLTLGTCVAIGQVLNFANIIALPLLFGIGVAFHIYFVMAWRSEGSRLLASSLARGVFFSALTTATGFGSLWASSHPGTASMGKLLMISLVWTLASALLFQPALMGRASAKSGVAATIS